MDRERTDERLFADFRQGDAGAFALLLHKYRSPVYTFVCRLLGDFGHAEELTRQAFVRAARGAPEREIEVSFKARLYGIANEVCGKALRAGAAHSGESPEEEARPSSSDVDEGELPRPLSSALAGLSAEERGVLLLREQAQIPVAEIGAVLSLEGAAVEKRSRAALDALRRELVAQGVAGAAQVVETRLLLAPLSALRTPPATLDAPILEAARAQAMLLGEGTAGTVVETQAQEKPLSIEPLRIDAKARVRRGAPIDRRRFRLLRAGIALAVVVIAALLLFRPRPRPATPDEARLREDYAIRVRTPDARGPPMEAPTSAPPVAKEPQRPPHDHSPASADRKGPAAEHGQGEAPAKQEPAQKDLRPVAPQPAADPLPVEDRARSERRRSAFAAAAALYRQASALRQGGNDDDGAAWDLAHAVECLAAAGSFAEARAFRDELGKRFPVASGPQSLADRALRAAPGGP